MATVGILKIDIMATTGKLVAPIATASKHLTKFGVTAAGVGTMIKSALGPMIAFATAAFSVYKAISLIKNAFSQGDALQKYADSIGINADELASLQLASERTGAGVEALRAGLRRMSNAVSEAASGTGEAQRSFDALGLSADYLNTLSPDLQFRAVADAMEGVGNASDRVQYAMDIFGRGGVPLINTMRGGTEQLNAFGEEAERLGLHLGNQRRLLEMANDAMARLGDMIKGIAGQIAVALAPYVKYLSDRLLEAGIEGIGLGQRVKQGVDVAVNAVSVVLDAIDMIRTAFAYAQYGVQWFTTKSVEGIAWVAKQVEEFAEAVTQVIPWAFAQAQRFVANILVGIVTSMAEMIAFFDNKLPERFRTGIGQMAQDYAATLQDVVNQEPDIDIRDFGSEFTFGDTAQQFAAAMSDGLAQARTELDEFASREKLSDKLKRGVDAVIAEIDKASQTPWDVEIPEDIKEMQKDLKTGALERGSQEALSAILGTQDKDKQLEEAKKQTEYLRKISSPQYLIGMASIAW